MRQYRSKHLVNFRNNVDRGKEGKNAGLPIRSPKLSRHVHGLLPKRLILLGGDTGCVLAGTKIKIRKTAEKPPESIVIVGDKG